MPSPADGGGSDGGQASAFQVTEAEAGLRLDAFLVRRAVVSSAAAARRLLAEAGAQVDGRWVRKGERLQTGQVVQLSLPARAPERAGPGAEPDLQVLYADEALVALVKPAGLPCHPLRAGERATLATALLRRFPECAAAGRDPREAGLAHRLDIGTSGVILAARRPEVYTALRQLLGGGGSEKHYLAEVVGVPRHPEAPAAAQDDGPSWVVDVPIGRQGRRGTRVVLGGGRGALPARTEVRLLSRAGAGGTSLVEARLHTGRAHQVRAHLAYLGAPILGDSIYGDAAALALATARGVEGFRLHAWRLRLVHPVTGQSLLFEAPPPAWAAARQEPG